MSPALAVQCSNQLIYEDPYIGSRPIELNKLAATYIIFTLRHLNGFWEENVMELLSMLVSRVFLFFSLTVLSSLC